MELNSPELRKGGKASIVKEVNLNPVFPAEQDEGEKQELQVESEDSEDWSVSLQS